MLQTVTPDNNTLIFGDADNVYKGWNSDGMGMLRLQPNTFLTCYSAGNDGQCNIGGVNGDVINTTQGVRFSNSTVDELTFAVLGGTEFLICYVDNAGHGTGKCHFAAISGFSLKYGPQTMFSSTPVDETNVLVLPPSVANSTLLLCYVDINARKNPGMIIILLAVLTLLVTIMELI